MAIASSCTSRAAYRALPTKNTFTNKVNAVLGEDLKQGLPMPK